jgi:amino acid transporter
MMLFIFAFDIFTSHLRVNHILFIRQSQLQDGTSYLDRLFPDIQLEIKVGLRDNEYVNAPQIKTNGEKPTQPFPKRLGLSGLVWVIFFTVSGGAYGLEPLVGKVGPGVAVALVLLVPLLWCLPIALMVSEMTSAMPREGGYYVWVRKGLGEFWGFQEGWWSICYAFVDIAIYPVLFVHYLTYFFPQLAAGTDGALPWSILVRWLVAVLVIGAALLVNWRGAKAAGRSDTFNAWLVLVPFGLIVTFWLMREGAVSSALSTVAADFGQHRDAGLLSCGLAIVLWNYSGWDNVSTFAGEVDTPERNYPRALMINLALVAAAYLLPLLAGIAITTDRNVWSEEQGWPVIAQALGGNWLGAVVGFAALCSTYSLFNSQLLYASRLPYAMALEGWLPKPLARTLKRTGVPIVALIALCAISAVFAAMPFGKLVILDILLYGASLSLEFVALIALRRKEPDMKRPFRIPGGWPSLVLVTLAPMFLLALVLITSLSGEDADPRQALILCGVVIAGIAIYMARRRKVMAA